MLLGVESVLYVVWFDDLMWVMGWFEVVEVVVKLGI